MGRRGGPKVLEVNLDRLHESLGDLPPAEFEALYAPQTKTTITL